MTIETVCGSAFPVALFVGMTLRILALLKLDRSQRTELVKQHGGLLIPSREFSGRWRWAWTFSQGLLAVAVTLFVGCALAIGLG